MKNTIPIPDRLYPERRTHCPREVPVRQGYLYPELAYMLGGGVVGFRLEGRTYDFRARGRAAGV